MRRIRLAMDPHGMANTGKKLGAACEARLPHTASIRSNARA